MIILTAFSSLLGLMCIFKPNIMWDLDPRTDDTYPTDKALKKIKREGYAVLALSVYLIYLCVYK